MGWKAEDLRRIAVDEAWDRWLGMDDERESDEFRRAWCEANGLRPTAPFREPIPGEAPSEWKPGDIAFYGIVAVRLVEPRPGNCWLIESWNGHAKAVHEGELLRRSPLAPEPVKFDLREPEAVPMWTPIFDGRAARASVIHDHDGQAVTSSLKRPEPTIHTVVDAVRAWCRQSPRSRYAAISLNSDDDSAKVVITTSPTLSMSTVTFHTPEPAEVVADLLDRAVMTACDYPDRNLEIALSREDR